VELKAMCLGMGLEWVEEAHKTNYFTNKAAGGRWKCLKVLVDFGVDCTRYGKGLFSPIHRASKKHDINSMDILLRLEETKFWDAEGCSRALIYRIYFIKEGADPLTRLVMTSLILNALNARGSLPLEELFSLLNKPGKALEIVKGFFAVRSSMCLIYLGEFGFKFDTKNYYETSFKIGDLALGFACEVGNLDLVCYLGSQGMEMRNIIECCGEGSGCILCCCPCVRNFICHLFSDYFFSHLSL